MDDQNGSSTATGQAGTGFDDQKGSPAGTSQTVTGGNDHTGSTTDSPPVATNSGGQTAKPVVHENAPLNNGIAAASAHQSSMQASEIATSRETDFSAAGSVARVRDSASAATGDPGEGPAVRLVRVDPQAAPGSAPTANERDAIGGDNAADGNTGDALALANAAADDRASGPQAADLLAGAPALPLETLQEGIRDFLRELDQLGKVIIASPGGLSVTCWLLSALAAVGACEIARRQMRRKDLDLAANAADEPMFAWFPEGTDRPDEPEA